jgi:hypothetical protein
LKHFFVSISLFVLILSGTVLAADPPIYLNAGNEGKALLDSLDRADSTKTLARAILSFNHAFYDKADADSKENARNYFHHLTATPVVKEYLLAIDLMDIRDAGKLQQLFSFLSGGPYDHARDVLKKMKNIQAANPVNDTILFLYTACNLEASMFMCDCLQETSQAMELLRQSISTEDTVKMFFLNLFEAKYSWVYSTCHDQPEFIQNALRRLDQAEKFAKNSYHRHEIELWRKKIDPNIPASTNNEKK